MLIFAHRPNMSAAGETTPADNSWHALTYPSGWPSALLSGGQGAQLALQTVNAAGTGTGDAFQYLVGQTSTPAGDGLMVPAGALWLLDGVPSGIWVKLSTASDVLRAFVLS